MANHPNAYRFALIVAAEPMTTEEICDVTDALGEAGCTGASIRGHAEGMELLFERKGRALQTALASAIAAVELTGYPVLRIEMEREAIAP